MRSSLRFLSLSALLAGCTTVRAVQPTELSPPHPPARVWVTRADRSTVRFDSASLQADSLIGKTEGVRQSVPLSDVTLVRESARSPARTTALALGLTGVTVALAYEFLFKPSDHHCEALCSAACGCITSP
jgi:hypothetical protein